MKMKVYAIVNQKGGTGKSTTAAILAQAAAHKGKKVLAIDLDPQKNLTYSLGADSNQKGSYEVITGSASLKEATQTKGNIDIIPASLNTASLKTSTGSASRLYDALKTTKKYDLVFIDTPPTIGEQQFNALMAATAVIVPMEADIYNLQSLYQIAETIETFKKSNKALKNSYFILTKFDGRSTLTRQMQQTITVEANALGIKFLGCVRAAIAAKEAAALQQDIFEYSPKCKPAKDYLEILEKLI